MKRVRNFVRVIALTLLLSMMTMGVFAAENGSVWITETDTDDGTAAFIITDATVTDGVVAVKYDAEKLTYQDVTVNETYVAMHSVNADEAGVVRISWVAPEAVQPEDIDWLIQVNFAGTSDEAVTLEGTLTGAVIVGTPLVDKTELQKTVLEAQGLNEESYTAETWAELEEALAAAEAVLADPCATQEEVDAAAAALKEAIDGLELVSASEGDVDKSALEKAVGIAEGLEKDNYTGDSWNALEEALEDAKAVLNDADATQEEVDAAAATLNEAIDGLELVSASEGDVDKSALEKAVGTAEGLKKDSYTGDSWKALEEALEEAKAVLNDADATQEEVDAATAALNEAIDGLKLKNAADTGDDANLVLPVVLATVCVVAILAVCVCMVKEKKGGKA